MTDFLGKTACVRCGDEIDTGEYRVVVAVSEYRSDDYGRPSRGSGFVIAFCDQCVATAPKLEVPNNFKVIVEDRASDAVTASPHGVDALEGKRAVSGHGGRVGEDQADEAGDEQIGAADREAVEFAAQRPPWQNPMPEVPLNLRSVESVRRETLRRYLASPASRGRMAPNLRRAVTLFVEGNTHRDIAQRLGKDQSTVTRMLQGALRLANAT